MIFTLNDIFQEGLVMIRLDVYSRIPILPVRSGNLPSPVNLVSLNWALKCYFESMSAPVIYALLSPSAKCVKLKGAL